MFKDSLVYIDFRPISLNLSSKSKILGIYMGFFEEKLKSRALSRLSLLLLGMLFAGWVLRNLLSAPQLYFRSLR